MTITGAGSGIGNRRRHASRSNTGGDGSRTVYVAEQRNQSDNGVDDYPAGLIQQ
jgi:hypothetical protein